MRRVLKYILFLLLAINIPTFSVAQSTSVIDRTPEQEAVKQTDKMQKELNLTPEQVKNIYEINLKYARERKHSNKRSDAVNRIRSKTEEIGKVLNDRQNYELQTKRSEVQSVEIDGKRQSTRTDANTRFNSGQNSETNTRTQFRDRPVRTDRSQRQIQTPASDRYRSTSDKMENPVRRNDSRTEVGRRTRDVPYSVGGSSSSSRSVQQGSTRSSSSESRSSSQPASRESGSRR